LAYAAQFPDEGSEAAELGTLQHGMVEAELSGETLDPELEAYRATLSEAQLGWIQDNVDLCVEIISDLDVTEIHLEEKIPHEFLHGEHGGTIDVVAVRARGHDVQLHVIDFKFGNVPVPIEDNSQIKCYLNLAKQRYPHANSFWGSILQPAVSDRLQTVEFSAEELEAHEVAVVEASISDKMEAGDHCKWCPALVACQTAAKHLHAQVDTFPDLSTVDKDVEPSAEMLADVARAYKVAKMAEKVTDGAGPLLKAWNSLGVNIKEHGFSVSTTNRKVWTEDAAVQLLAAGVPEDKIFRLETMTAVAKALGMSAKEFKAEYSDAFKDVPSSRLNMGKLADCPEFDEL
jgi:hypothetical protein